jgi:hypothetical protein
MFAWLNGKISSAVTDYSFSEVKDHLVMVKECSFTIGKRMKLWTYILELRHNRTYKINGIMELVQKVLKIIINKGNR